MLELRVRDIFRGDYGLVGAIVFDVMGGRLRIDTRY